MYSGAKMNRYRARASNSVSNSVSAISASISTATRSSRLPRLAAAHSASTPIHSACTAFA